MIRQWTISAASTVLALGLSIAVAKACEVQTFQDAEYTVCIVDPATEDLRLFHADAEGEVYGTFSRLSRSLEDQGLSLQIAMNGGMYHDDLSPVGHYVEGGVETVRLITSDGPGNFGLLPNGVFCLLDTSPVVLETQAFKAAELNCDFATQSGPMLVIDGELHPRFIPNSTSRHLRNGVGVTSDGKVAMVISNDPVTFHQFASLFRDQLGAKNALFLDGKVSRLFAPEFGRRDAGFPMGPILGTVERMN